MQAVRSTGYALLFAHEKFCSDKAQHKIMPGVRQAIVRITIRSRFFDLGGKRRVGRNASHCLGKRKLGYAWHSLSFATHSNSVTDACFNKANKHVNNNAQFVADGLELLNASYVLGQPACTHGKPQVKRSGQPSLLCLHMHVSYDSRLTQGGHSPMILSQAHRHYCHSLLCGRYQIATPSCLA